MTKKGDLKVFLSWNGEEMIKKIQVINKHFGVGSMQVTISNPLNKAMLASKKYKEDNNLNEDNLNIIRITSDCPFVDTVMINDMIDFFNNKDYDYIINHSHEITPEGSGIEIINYKSLEYLWNTEKNS